MMAGTSVEKVISGGQTGVDRAGLDAAIEAGIAIGGYCPKGGLAENGRVPEKYCLQELIRGGYPARTERNAAEADGTLIINVAKLSGGTRFTVKCARKHSKPYFIVQLDGEPDPDAVIAWIREHGIRVLNVAGPRESKAPGIYLMALEFLRRIFALPTT